MRPLGVSPSNSSSRSFTPIVALATGLALSVLVRIANEWGDEVVLVLSASVLCLLFLIVGGLKAVRVEACNSLVMAYWALAVPALIAFCFAGIFTIRAHS